MRVSASAIDVLHASRDRIAVRIQCSAGFYVRSLAHDLGQRLGTGAHLVSLRRTKSGDVTLEQAVPLDAIEHGDEGAAPQKRRSSRWTGCCPGSSVSC